MQSLERLAVSGDDPPARLIQKDVEDHPVLFSTPVLAAVLAEILLGRGKAEEALRVLHAAIDKSPNDLRLRQLMGLAWSRLGLLDLAIDCLEPLYTRFSDDEETAGILAGVYKRRWVRDRSNVADLEKSHHAYKKAWKFSGKKSTYVGINSATTALFLGRREEAGKQALEIENLLRQRTARLPGNLIDSRLDFRFWDQVTLGEAQLLQGHWETARDTYRAAFQQHPERSGDIDVSRRQRDEILKILDLPPMND
jgi:tetratricopeptide (TPR) repeat protein